MSQADIDPTILNDIKGHIEKSKVVLFMKGTPQFPMCGFSSQAVQALNLSGCQEFHSVNVLENPDIRANLPVYAEWPTFPQLWVDNELVGGCDIIVQMYNDGSLKSALSIEADA
jgi:monothiol glutaredoxin